MTTFNIYCHRFEEQRLEKSREKQRKLGHKEGYDDMASFSVLQQHGKLNLRSTFQIHKGGPQNFKTRGKKINTEIYFVL